MTNFRFALLTPLMAGIVACSSGGSDGDEPTNPTPIDGGGDRAPIALDFTSDPSGQAGPTEEARWQYQILTSANVADSLTFELVSGPEGMTVSSAGLVQWTPDDEHGESVQVTLRAIYDDGTSRGTAEQTFTLAVTPVNDRPAIVSAEPESAIRGQTFTFQIDVEDPDDANDGSNLEFSASLPWVSEANSEKYALSVSSTGLVQLTVPDSFSYNSLEVNVAVIDGGEDWYNGLNRPYQRWQLAIVDGNTAPVITSTALTEATEDVAYQYQLEVTDAEDANNGADLTFELVAGPADMSVSSTGLVSWTPLEQGPEAYSESATVRVSDGGENGVAPVEQSFDIAVTPVNDAPVINNTPTNLVVLGETYAFDFDISDSDDEVNGTDVTVSLVVGPAGMEVIGNQVIWTPTVASAAENVEVVIADGGEDGVGPQSVAWTIEVRDNNTAPVLSGANTLTTNEDTSASLMLSASDAEADTLTWSVTEAGYGTVSVSDSGEVTYQPTTDFFGEDAFIVTVSDGNLTDELTINVTVNAVNDAPVIGSEANTSATENAAYSYTATAVDVENDVLEWSLTQAPAGMTIDAASGEISWTPDGSEASVDVIVAVTDGTDTSTQAFAISVATVNDAPVVDQGANVTLSTNEDESATLTLSANDEESDPLTWSISQVAASGTASVVDGEVTYEPAPEFNGTDSFTVTVSDGSADVDVVVSVTVAAVNDAPVITEGANVTLATDEDNAAQLTLSASDLDGDALSWSIATAAANGTADVDANGMITYVPAPNFFGQDSVTVEVSDGELTATTTVAVTVSPVNDAPVITSPANTVAVEDAPYQYTVLAADLDSEVTFILSTAPQGMTIDAETGEISWTPANGVASADVTVVASDGELEATQSFTIAVSATNDAPEITSVANTSATEGVEYAYQPAANDADGDALIWSLTQAPQSMTINSATGEILWTPANGVASATVTLMVSDGVASDSQQFTITVEGVNDAPVITEGETATLNTNEDTQASLTLNATDADGNALNWSVAAAATHGEATVSGAGNSQTVTYVPNADFNGSDSFEVQVSDGTATDSITVNVTVAAVNDEPVITSTAKTTALESNAYSYRVTASDVDADSLTYTLSEAPEGMTISASGEITWTPANGISSADVTVVVSDGPLTATQSFTVTVSATNDAPEITSEAITTATEDVLYTYTVVATDIDADTTLEYRLITAPEGMTIDAQSGEINWTPEEGVSSANVVVAVSDGIASPVTQSFTISVEAVNDAPVIDQASAAITTDEDVAGSTTLTASDAEGDALTWTIDTAAAHGSAEVDAAGVVTYTPNADFNGDDSFVVAVSDGGVPATITVNVTVDAANDAPVIDQSAPAITTDEDTEASLVLSATDIDGDSLDWSITAAASNGTAAVDASGNVTYSPAADTNGSDSFTVEVSDGTGTDSRTVTVTVAAVNDAPEITSAAVTSAEEDTAYSYVATASDVDGDSLAFSLSVAPQGMSIDEASGEVSWTPENGVSSADVTVVVSDGALEASQGFTITVSATNDAPVIDQASAEINTAEDTQGTVTLTATDADGDNLSWNVSAAAGNGTATVVDGEVTYTPNADFNGSDSFTVEVTDGVESDTVVINVNVSAVNDAPVFANAASTSAVEDTPYEYNALVTDVDDANNGSDLIFTLITAPEGMTVSATGVVSWTPANGVASADVNLQVADGGEDGAAKAVQSWTITVGDVNDAPVITSVAPTEAIEDTLYQYAVQVTDPDDANNGTDLTFTPISVPAGMTISNMGLVEWTPANGITSVNVTVRVADGGESGAAPDDQSWTITVAPVNDAPTINEGATTTLVTDEDVAGDITLTATDIDGDSLTWSVSADATNGTATVTAAGVVTYTPAANVNGTDSFTVSVSDDEENDSIVVNVTVNAVNDVPVITSVAPTDATEDEAYSYSVIATDADADTLTYSLTTKPTGMSIDAADGSISWTPANGVTSANVTVQVSDAQSSVNQSFTITVAAVNDAPTFTSTPLTGAIEDTQYRYTLVANDVDGDALTFTLVAGPGGMALNGDTLEWTPANGVTSADVTVEVSDGTLTATQSYTITVGATNDAPVISEGDTATLTTDEDTQGSLTLNATDIDGDTINWTISVPATQGSAVVSGSGNSQSISYTPNADFNGNDSFTVQVSDGTATDSITVSVTVSAVNDAPEFTSVPATAATEDQPYSYQATASDVDEDTLTFSLISGPQGLAVTSAGAVTWTPENGVTSGAVVLAVTDGTVSVEQAFTITVTAVNDAPEFTSVAVTEATEDEAYAYDVNATDVDGDTLTYSLTAAPAGMSIDAASGQISWTPENGVESANVTVSVTDATTTVTQSFTITVTAVNDAPEITSAAVVGATEDTPYVYQVTATDIDGDSLSFSLSTAPEGMSIDAQTGEISWTPENGVTSADVTVEVSDGTLADTQSYTITVTATNDAPEIADGETKSVTFAEDTFAITSQSATDIDGNVLTWSISQQAGNGTAAIAGQATGNTVSISYRGNADFNGEDTFTVQVTDGTATDSIVYTVTVTPANDAPVFTSSANTEATEDIAYVYDANATDVDGDTLTYSLTAAPAGMTIDAASGAINWTPENGVTSADVTVTVADATVSVDQSFTITVTGTNDAPEITSVATTEATEDEAYSYDVDATDIDGDALSFSLTDAPAGMTIDATSGVISWTPGNGVTSANVTVQVTDTALTDSQSFTITVTPVNDAPEITEGESATLTTDEDNMGSLTLNATDIDGDTITWSISGAATHGSVVVSGTGSSQVVNYTPDADFNGTDSFVVQVSDSVLTDTITINVTVNAANDAPAITSDAVLTATEDEAYSYTVAANDVDGDSLTYSLSAAPAGMTIDAATGAISWTPENGVTSADVTVVVADASASLNATQSFTITVTPVNDAPEITSAAITGATEGSAYVYDVEATDIDGDSLTFSLTTAPIGMTIDAASGEINWTPENGVTSADVTVQVTDGTAPVTQSFTITVTATNDAPVIDQGATATLATNEDEAGALTLTATDIDGDSLSWSISGAASQGTATVVDGNVSYTPAADVNGSDSFTVQVSDGNATDTILVNVSVASVADAPVITEGETSAQTTAEDVVKTFALNASDVDSSTLTWSIVAAAGNGTASVSGTGSSQTVSYAPAENFSGNDSFVVQVSDGALTDTITVNMTVTAVNDLPVITSAAITSATEGEVYSYVPTATDVENDTLTWNVGTAPAAMTVNSTTGELTWTPEEGVTSADVTLLVNDGGANVTQSFTITVTPVNDAPVITEGESVAVTMSEDGVPTSFALVLNATDTDHTGTSLTWTIDAAATNGSATVTGTGNSKAVTYAPAADFSGDDSFTVAVSDGDLTDTVTVNVTVEAVNDAPVINEASAALTTDEDTEGSLTLTASDVESDSLTWSVTSAATQGSASVSNGAITYVPAANFNGSDSFTVEVSDGNASDSITVDVTVNAANDAPEITSTAVTSATEGVAYGYTVTASDIDGDTLSFALTTAPAGMTIDSASGVISWTPGSGVSTADVTVEVSDSGLTASQSFTINVTSVNAAPVIDQGASTTLNTNEDTTATLQLSATDSDGDSLTWSISSGASKGGVAVNAAGLVTYVPAADENGSDAFEVSVFDGTETATIAVSVDIAAVNDLPVINEGTEVTLTVNEDEFGNITLTATDVDGDTLTWSVQTGAVNGIVTQTGSEFSYSPSVDFNGDDSFIVQVSDGTASGTSTVSVTVVAVNDAPVVTSSANTSATQYQVYAYDVTATDVENDAMSFSLSTAPEGMSISGTGEVRWMPDTAGTYAVTVAVSDGNATGEQSFNVTVGAAQAVNGRAVKGVMSGAIVEAAVYTGLDANGDHSWSVIGTTTTDANGYYGFDLGAQSAPVRIRVTTTVDTQMVCDTPSGCLLAPPAVFGESGAPAVDMVMDSIVTGSNFAGTIAVTPMTHMAAAWLQAFPDALDDNAVALAHTRLATLFGFADADYVHHRMIDLTDSFERDYAVANDMQAMRHAIFSASLQETAIVASLSIDSVTDNIALIFGLLGGQMPLKSGELDVSTLGLTDPDTAEPINTISYTGFDTFVASAKTVANYVNDGDLTSMIGEFDALVTNWTPELADASLCLDNTTVDLDRSDCRNVTTIGGATGFDATLFARALAPIDVAGSYLDDAQAAELANGNTVNRDLGWLYVDEATQNETAEMLSALSTVLGYATQTAVCVPQIANSQPCSVTPGEGYETLSTSITACEFSGFSTKDDSCTLSVSGQANGQSVSVTSRVPDIRKMLGGDRIWPAPNFVAGALPLCFNGTITNSVAEMNLTNFCVILNVSDSLPGLLTPFEDLYASDYAAIGEDGSTSDDGQPSAAYTAMQNLLAKVVLEVAATGALSISDVNNTIGTYSMSNMDMSFVFDRESLVDLSKGTPVFDFEVTSFSRTNPWGETLNSVSGTPMFKLQVDDSSLLTGSNVKDNVGVPPVLSVTNAQVSGLGPVVDVAKEYALSLIDTNATVTERTQEQWDALIAEVEANLTYKGSITTTVQDAAADNPTYIATLTGDGDVFISQKNSEDNAMQLYLSGATGYVYADNMLVATAHLGNSQDGMLLSFVDGSQRSYKNANPNLNSQLQSFLDFLQVLVPPTEETTTTP